MTKLRQMLRLHIEGKSKSEIAHLTHTSRNTVKRYLRILEREQLKWEHQEALPIGVQRSIRKGPQLESERGQWVLSADPMLDALSGYL